MTPQTWTFTLNNVAKNCTELSWIIVASTQKSANVFMINRIVRNVPWGFCNKPGHRDKKRFSTVVQKEFEVGSIPGILRRKMVLLETVTSHNANDPCKKRKRVQWYVWVCVCESVYFNDNCPSHILTLMERC